jgi:hypothetical protein
VLCIAHAGIRRENEVEEKEVTNAKAYTVSDLIAAVRLVREVEQAQAQQQGLQRGKQQPVPVREPVDVSPALVPAARAPEPIARAPEPVDSDLEQNVMQLLTARAAKKEA